MTLAERIIKKLRQDKDGGLTSKQLAIFFALKEEKVEAAARALQEQEHLILGSDGCWYLGDALAAGSAHVSAPEPEPELLPDVAPEPPTMEETPDLTEETVRESVAPIGFQVEPPMQEKPKSIPATNQFATNQFGALPAWVMVEAWINARSELAIPISWTEFSKEIGIRKTTLGKARATLIERGKTDLVAKLDRLVYREDSKSMRERAGVGGVEERRPLMITCPDGSITDDLKNLWAGLEKQNIPPLPGPLADYLELLNDFDLICENQGFEPDRVIRRRIAELMAWLREVTQ